MVRRLAALALALAVAACAVTPADFTSDFTVGDPSGEANAFAPGTELWAGTSSFLRNAGDPVELVSVTPLGLPDGITYQSLVSPSSRVTELGLFAGSAVPTEIRAETHQLAGTRLAASDDWSQVIIVFTMPAQEVLIHGYRLSYRMVDGAERTVFVPYSDHICLPPRTDACMPVVPFP